jgi:DNA primase
MLLDQCAGDLVAVATMGANRNRLTPRWIFKLLPMRLILAAYDADAPGAIGAMELAETMPGRVRSARERPEGGKDLTDWWQRGGDLRGWVVFNLNYYGANGWERRPQ